jgi:hypothetical protein
MTRPQDPRTLKQHGVQVQIAPLDPIGPHISNTDISTQVVLTPPMTTTGSADKILIQSLDQNTRFTLDCSLPIGTGTQHGFVIPADDPPMVIGISDGLCLTVVEEAATAELQYQWGQ